MPNKFENALLRSFSEFENGLPIEGPRMDRKRAALKAGEGSYAFNGRNYSDLNGNVISCGCKQDIQLTCKVEGIFWNGRLIMDGEAFPEYKSINLAKIRCVTDEQGNTFEGEFRFDKPFKGTMRLFSGETQTGEFNIRGELLNVPYVDPEATLPDPVPEEPPAAPFRLHLSFSDDSVPGSDQL